MIRELQTQQNPRKLVIVDILSDLVLRQKAVTTRRWLSDFVTRRKAEGYTVQATFNPMIGSKEDAQTIIDCFDGVISIFEKEIGERYRRFLVIKKMRGRKYSEKVLMLDKDRLL